MIMSYATTKRLKKFETVAAQRQRMTVVLENVHDPHNIGAVMRSCDAVGIDEIYVLYTEDRYDFDRLDKLGSSSAGVRKWLQVHCFRDVNACFLALRKKYQLILATHLNSESEVIYDKDLTVPVAFMFGNEHEGLSESALEKADGNILIPQMGMAQSLNISVACAVTIFEALRQRRATGMYNDILAAKDGFRQSVYDRFKKIHEASYKK